MLEKKTLHIFDWDRGKHQARASCHQTVSDGNYWMIRTLLIAKITSSFEESGPA